MTFLHLKILKNFLQIYDCWLNYGEIFGTKRKSTRVRMSIIRSRFNSLRSIFVLEIVSFIFLFLTACSPTITLNTTTIAVEIADEPFEHQQGLMHRTFLPHNQGMLFIFDDEQQRTFWMKNTNMPLDIIFISADKKIVDIKQNFQPCTQEQCETYTSKSAHYVLEVNAGFTQRKKLTIGMQAII